MPRHRQTLIEIALIFAVFAVQGAWPVPDVNEPYYLGKAIHYWNPDWLQGDFFMESADTHKVFYFTFGWLSLWLSPTMLAWTGRILTWLSLAWAWRRLSSAVIPRHWYSVLTAALFACLMERCHMAGEWVIGGVEAKGFAYAFVFLGLEGLVRNRWNQALLMFGAASALHVLVGGWFVVATALAWLWLKRSESFATPNTADVSHMPPLHTLWPGILGGLLLSLPGLIPSLILDWGVDRETVWQAHQIYVFERLPHHLTLAGIRPTFILRLTLLWGVWLALPWINRGDETIRRLRALVAGAVAISLIGAAIHLLIPLDRAWAADLLRYYWFRTTDVVLPLGVALEVAALIVVARANRSAVGRRWLAFALLLIGLHLGSHAWDRFDPAPPRSHRIADFDAWRDACRWVAESGEVPPDARFITPRLAQTFKWYTGRDDVATWKDVPQEAHKIVGWWERIQDIYATGQPPPSRRWNDPLAKIGSRRMGQLGTKYGADYTIVQRTDPPLNFDVVYHNRTYVVYRLR